MYKRWGKKNDGNLINVLFYQLTVCIFILSFVLVMNSINTVTSRKVIDTVKYWLTSNYDFLKAYEDLKQNAPVLRQKFMSTFEQIEKMSAPVKGTITSRYGMRINPITKKSENHTGIDISATQGSDVYAAWSGTVKSVKEDANYGTYVVIDHGNGYSTLYAHLKAVSVKTGENVKRGDIIGKVGNSGESTAPHLHFEVLKGGNPVDPLNLLSPDMIK
ncbi:M23 family metallopeptidase [Caldanaerobius polysaccharolyticus]|uniref:M23 family metallopeptidase n=1 Tax=Caldanaerobius polysaccharolyticus TaxID=44256 RepID=UPI00068E552F|nr:M23 family metallopeptidase [Caldanaerobius polysaccharolyticus]